MTAKDSALVSKVGAMGLNSIVAVRGCERSDGPRIRCGVILSLDELEERRVSDKTRKMGAAGLDGL